jgi:hypothetical protein
MEIHSGWEWGIFFCVFVSFPVSDSETESAKSSSFLAKRSAMEWPWISSLSAFDVFALVWALALPRKPF